MNQLRSRIISILIGVGLVISCCAQYVAAMSLSASSEDGNTNGKDSISLNKIGWNNHNQYEEDSRDLNYFDLKAFGSNAFMQPDEKETGRLVAQYKEDSSVNPEELGPYFEGDILMPQNSFAKSALMAHSSRWSNGVVPYVIAGSFSTSELAAIKTAFEEYHRRTCIQFKPRAKERDYIEIVNGNSGCWSSVGRLGGKQQVNLQTPSCLLKPGTVLHELMHVLGFIHEQNRYERDRFVVIRAENVKDDMMVNFAKTPKTVAQAMGLGYDYASVMHYSPSSFSKNGKNTIEAKMDTPEAKLMGQRFGFSPGDLAKINLLYKCKKSYSENDYELELEYITA